MRLEVGRVGLDEPVDRRPHRIDDGGRRGGVGERDVAGQALRVDGVVGRGGADLGEPRRLGRARELPHVLPVVEPEHHAPVAPEHPAERRRHLAGDAPPGLGIGRGHDGRPEHSPAPGGVAEPLLRPRHQLDRRQVRVLEGPGPRAEAVLLEHDGPRVRLGADRRPDLSREPEAGAAVGHPDDLLPEQVLDDLPPALRVRQADDGVGVRVDDGLRVQEAVEQGLDRRPRRAGLLETAREVVDHLLVAHVVTLEEGEHLGQAHAGEVAARDALEVRAAPLDPQDPDGPARADRAR